MGNGKKVTNRGPIAVYEKRCKSSSLPKGCKQALPQTKVKTHLNYGAKVSIHSSVIKPGIP